ncbi:hypothetical protein L0128_05110 [candidate division KSB1 bacterium]|nr:hypothetical protein [candidate division KSB1 bacterium]
MRIAIAAIHIRISWTAPGDAQNHARSIQSANWSMADCQGCHGNDYLGGKSKSSCYTCHQQGPDACNVCHGSANNPAPPKDLNGRTATTELTVGAHQHHLNMGLNCTVCHHLPATFNSPEHIDQTAPAEVLKDLAWDRTKATCTTVCHYDPNKAYIWNKF